MEKHFLNLSPNFLPKKLHTSVIRTLYLTCTVQRHESIQDLGTQLTLSWLLDESYRQKVLCLFIYLLLKLDKSS